MHVEHVFGDIMKYIMQFLRKKIRETLIMWYFGINPFFCFVKIPCILVTIILGVIPSYVEENSVMETIFITIWWSWLFQCFVYTLRSGEDLKKL